MADEYGAPQAGEAPAPARGKKGKQQAPDGLRQSYWREVERYDQATSQWRERGNRIVEKYLDENRSSASKRKFALLWSNIETLKPAIYAKTPSVVVSRRFKDPDPTGRTASELLERATNTTFDLYGVDDVLQSVRDDRLLVARGQAWVRYEADFEKATAETQVPDEKTGLPVTQTEEYERLKAEKACCDYVHWCDFGHNLARTWADVWLVWRRVYKGREEVKERFGELIASKLVYDAKPPEAKYEEAELKAVLYEMWDKKRRRVVFLSKDCPEVLEDEAPPLNFRRFFPCPKPCYGTLATKSLIPTPDYEYYRDQAAEIDDLTDKIANLTKWLIVKGIIPGGPSSEGPDAIERLIREKDSELFVTVESWAGFADKGGLRGMIDWLPLDQVMAALRGAIESRAQLLEDVYQITGISDILRGQSDPSETLGAQEIKAQTGSRRVKTSRDEIARFARDLAEMVAEVIAEQFQPQTISDMTGMAYVPVPPPEMQQQDAMAAQASVAEAPARSSFDDKTMALLRNDRLRGFRIDIETDSTVQPDENAEKQKRMEFIQAVGGFLQQAVAGVQTFPQMAPMMGEMLMFVVRGFSAGRSLEDIIEKTMAQAAEQAAQAASQPKPPSPEEMQAQAAQAKAQADQQAAQQKHELEMASKGADLQFKQQEHQMKLAEMQAEMEMRERELAAQERELQMKERAVLITAAAKEREAAATIRLQERQNELNAESMENKHRLAMQPQKPKAKTKPEQRA